MIVGAFYRRALGGGFKIKRSVLNVSYALFGFSAAFLLTGGNLLISLVTAIVLVGAHTGPLHGESMDRGHSGGTWLGDSAIMSARFMLWGVPLVWLTGVHPAALVACGILASSAYDIAYILFELDCIKQPTVLAEWLQGAFWESTVFVILVLSFLI